MSLTESFFERMRCVPHQEVLPQSIAEPFLEIFIQDNLRKSVDVLPHYHECYEILYLLHGSAKQAINEKRYTVNEGDFILIKPSDLHETHCKQGDNVKILVIKFMPEFIEGGALKPSELHYISEFINLNCEPVSKLSDENPLHREIISLLERILAEFTERKTGFELSLKGCLYLLVAELFRADIIKSSPYYKAFSDLRILPLLKLIEESEENAIHLSEAAEELHLNYSYCSRYFKKATGKGFKEYLDFIKIRKAEELMLTQGASVTEAAIFYGFSSVSAFSRTYKRVRGYLPSKLKK